MPIEPNDGKAFAEGGPVACELCGVLFCEKPSGILTNDDERFIAVNAGWRVESIRDEDKNVIGERIQCTNCRPKSATVTRARVTTSKHGQRQLTYETSDR